MWLNTAGSGCSSKYMLPSSGYIHLVVDAAPKGTEVFPTAA